MGNLFQELNRRKVFRVAAVYAVVAWLLIQVADTVLPALQMPEWTVSFVTVLFILGFPIALILAWAYEVTPTGIKADSANASPAVATHHGDRKLIYATFVLVLIVAGFQFVDRFIIVSTGTDQVTSFSSGSAGVQSVIRSSINLGRATDGGIGIIARPAISPDGSRIAYTKSLDDGVHLYVRELDQLESRELASLSNPSSSLTPFFSPDSQQVAYRDGGNLMRVSVRGDSPQVLATGLQESFIAWESDQNIIFTDGNDQSLRRIAAVGGVPQPIELDIPAREQQLLPHVLPGGEAILYNEAAGRIITRGIRLANLETGEVRTLIERGYAGRYAASGHIVFMRAATLWAVPFDLERLETIGPQVPVVQGIQTLSQQGLAAYSFSDNGRLVYRPGLDIFGGRPETTIVWVDRDGNEERLDFEPNQYAHPQISPDGEFISLTIPDGNGNTDIWIQNLRRGVLSRLTSSGAAEAAIWTPDSENLLFGTREGDWGIWIVAANGASEAEPLVREDDILRAETVSPDGGHFLYRKGAAGPRLYASSMDGDRSGQTLFASAASGSSNASEAISDISPDGRWIAYQSFETGQFEIYVRPYPNVNEGKWQITSNGGRQPKWGPEGKELYYLRGGPPNAEVRVVSIETESGFSTGIPETLFSGNYSLGGVFGGGSLSYDVTADGQRFLMSKLLPQVEVSRERNEPSLVLVENWFAELNRLAPPDPQ
jgi:serine/threonine-protein kinase